jgi:hypothetical protein
VCEWATSVKLGAGLNVMDLTALNVEMQHLVIRSTIDWVLAHESDTVVVVPEAWKFIPQGRGTPVKLAAESYIRQRRGSSNYLWLDSQDIAGVEKIILKSVPVWVLGVQREANEIKRTLAQIPAGIKKPKPTRSPRSDSGSSSRARHAHHEGLCAARLDDDAQAQVATGHLTPELAARLSPRPTTTQGATVNERPKPARAARARTQASRLTRAGKRAGCERVGAERSKRRPSRLTPRCRKARRHQDAATAEMRARRPPRPTRSIRTVFQAAHPAPSRLTVLRVLAGEAAYCCCIRRRRGLVGARH